MTANSATATLGSRRPLTYTAAPKTTIPRTPGIFDRGPSRTLSGDMLPVAFFHWRDELIYVVEPPAGRADANLLVCHGLTDHAARHLPTAAWLAAAGYRVLLFDLKGHGGQGQPIDDSWRIKEAYAGSELTPRVSARLGRLRAMPAFSERFRDRRFRALKRSRISDHLAQLAGIAGQLSSSQRFEGELPLFLMGHGMGGLICAEVAWRGILPVDPRGVIVANPAFRRKAPAGWLSESLPGGGLPPLELDSPIDTTRGLPYLSEQPDEVALYRADPLTGGVIPAAYASSIETQMAATDRRRSPFPCDVLVLLPGHDGITSVRGGLDFARKVPTARRSLVRFHRVRAHDMMRSGSRAAVRGAVDAWIRSTIGEKQTIRWLNLEAGQEPA